MGDLSNKIAEFEAKLLHLVFDGTFTLGSVQRQRGEAVQICFDPVEPLIAFVCIDASPTVVRKADRCVLGREREMVFEPYVLSFPIPLQNKTVEIVRPISGM